MNNEIEFYINENGIACVPLKLYNDSLEEIERLNNIIKEIIDTLNNKREILVTQLLDGGYCDYEELLYQVDEEIRKILDKEYK